MPAEQIQGMTLYGTGINIENIRRLAGDISKEQLAHVDVFLGRNAGVFIPATGHCGYSISENHTHPSFSFFYSLDKTVSAVVNGKKEDSPAGVLSFIPPGLPHHEIPEDSFVRFTAIMICTDFFSYHAADYRIGETIGLPGKFPMTGSIRSCVREFIVEVSSKRAGFEKLIDPLEIRLAHAILRTMSGTNAAESAVSVRFEIEKVIEHINANFYRTVSVEEMASLTALSPSHFSRLFRKETGMSPQEYLIDTRLLRARSYLLTSDKSIIEIANVCGFANSAHLTSSFKSRYGVTPSGFRKNI
jgi:AraC family transcriptional regulator